MDRQIFNLKFTAKQMSKTSGKCEKHHTVEKNKCKTAIIRGNMEIARIHAENAIRYKNQSIAFLTMSARLDSIASRVQYASTMQHIVRSLDKVTRSMEHALQVMNLEELCRILDKFEHECLEMDVRTTTMETSMQEASTSFAPHNEVDIFMQQVAEEAGLDISLEMPSTRTSLPVSESVEKDELEKRFGALRKN